MTPHFKEFTYIDYAFHDEPAMLFTNTKEEFHVKHNLKNELNPKGFSYNIDYKGENIQKHGHILVLK